MIERRTDKREILMQMARYAPSPQTSDTVLRGMIKDWSGSGICLIALQPLDEGQEVIVNSIIAPSSKKATVRWQQTIGKDTYKVGLEFRR